MSASFGDFKHSQHDQSTSNTSGSHFRSIDGNTGILHSNSDTHYEARSEQPLPGLGKSTRNRGDEENNGRDPDLPATTEVVVDRIGEPNTDTSSDKVDDGVDRAHLPGVGACSAVDTKFDREREVGGVRAGLIPALDTVVSSSSTSNLRSANSTHHHTVP
jgi:hypothetical protein